MKDAFGHPQSIVVLGGSSEIALEMVRRTAADRCRSLVLAGRDEGGLALAADVLRSTVSAVKTVRFDAASTEGAEATVTECFEAIAEPVDLLIVAVGELGHQEADEHDPERVARMLTVNFTWPAAAMTAAAARMTDQGHGRLVVLSSVAGCRIRRSNFVYGSAKAALDAFARGLAESLRGTGVSLHIVRPGFVWTKMTIGRRPAPFAVGPRRVATDVARGLARGETVIWSPGVLRWLFALLRLLPQGVWRRLPE